MRKINEYLTNSQDERAVSTRTEQSNRKPVSLDNVEALFAKFAALYGARFAQMWKGTDLSVVKVTWADALSGLTVREVRTGLEACKMRPWPPTLPEFLLMCRPDQDFEKAFAEAQEQVCKRQSGKDVWSKKAVYWTAVEFGFFDLRCSSWESAKKKWSRIFSANLSRDDELPDVPEFRHALPAPGESVTDRKTALEKLAELKRRLSQKGDLCAI